MPRKFSALGLAAILGAAFGAGALMNGAAGSVLASAGAAASAIGRALSAAGAAAISEWSGLQIPASDPLALAALLALISLGCLAAFIGMSFSSRQTVTASAPALSAPAQARLPQPEPERLAHSPLNSALTRKPVRREPQVADPGSIIALPAPRSVSVLEASAEAKTEAKPAPIAEPSRRGAAPRPTHRAKTAPALTTVPKAEAVAKPSQKLPAAVAAKVMAERSAAFDSVSSAPVCPKPEALQRKLAEETPKLPPKPSPSRGLPPVDPTAFLATPAAKALAPAPKPAPAAKTQLEAKALLEAEALRKSEKLKTADLALRPAEAPPRKAAERPVDQVPPRRPAASRSEAKTTPRPDALKAKAKPESTPEGLKANAAPKPEREERPAATPTAGDIRRERPSEPTQRARPAAEAKQRGRAAHKRSAGPQKRRAAGGGTPPRPPSGPKPLTAPSPDSRLSDGGGRIGVIGIIASLFFFGGLALWGMYAPLESAVIAPGVVRVDTNRFEIDHPDGGVIAKLLVAEGDQVAAGQALIELDRTQLESELSVASRRFDEQRARLARHEAEMDGKDAIAFPADLEARQASDMMLAQTMERQIAVFAAAEAAQRAEIDVRQEGVQRLNERIGGLEQQIASLETQREIAAGEEAIQSRLFENGLATKSRLLALRKEVAGFDGSIASATASIAEARAEISEIQLETTRLRRERVADATERSRELSAAVQELEPQIDAIQARLDRTTISSPSDGVVFGLTEFAVGGAVRPGDVVLEIVPSNARLVIEARVRPVDRDSITPGMAAEVRLTAFNARTTAPFDGMLEQISADARFDEAQQTSHYQAVVGLSPEALRGYVVTPGMPADIVLPIKSRTPFEYLLEPLSANWNAALREE